MMRRIWALCLCAALLLSGCGWFDGSYVNVTPYQQHGASAQTEAVSANNYTQLRDALEALVSMGTESSVIYVADYNPDLIEENLRHATLYILEVFPLGAYAVEDISYEVGTSSGKPAIAVNIEYRRSKSEIRRIRTVKDIEKASEVIGEALRDVDSVMVLAIEEYRNTDFVQLVESYVERHPEYVMESPMVAVGIFGNGLERIVELNFTYQNSRDSLKQMKIQVQPMFDAAALYVTGAGEDRQKFAQLYSFLMERFDYKLETSLTPAYSLLCHGVGDSRAFAQVYASMCRRAGLECRIVTGTRNGEPWTWNLVNANGSYYHVDLLRCSVQGGFRETVDAEMSSYVWDYSAYPATAVPVTPTEPAAGSQETDSTEKTS